MSSGRDLLKVTSAARSLRDLAAKYSQSKDPHTALQSTLLSDMANDILSNNIKNAQFRYHNLHVNIRAQLSFEVMDMLGMAEEHTDEI